jgi:trk system potassium uptake protein TrkA
MGADRVVFPERDSGRRLAHLISQDSVVDVIEFPQGFVLEEMRVGSGFSGRTIEELNTNNRFGIWILLVYQNDQPITPKAVTLLNKGDVIIVFGKKDNVYSLERDNSGKYPV